MTLGKGELRRIRERIRRGKRTPPVGKSTGGQPWTKGQTFGDTKPVIGKRLSEHERLDNQVTETFGTKERISAGRGLVHCRICGRNPPMPGDDVCFNCQSE